MYTTVDVYHSRCGYKYKEERIMKNFFIDSNDVGLKEVNYEDAKTSVKEHIIAVIRGHEQFGLTASDVSKDMALVIAQAIREATKEDNNG